MKLSQAIEILEKYNEWRRGGDGEMQDPKELGKAIDLIITKIKGKQNTNN